MQSGFAGIKFAATAVLLSGLATSAGQVQAAELSFSVTGNLIGSVMDGAGAPQIGATVQLLNRYERVLAKTLTTSDGQFVFAGLPLDTYAVRISQPSFLPAFRDQIQIKPGKDSVLQIHLATLFSNIQVTYKLPSGAMTNDWKWALRTGAATRPVTRYTPPELNRRPAEQAARPQVFSDTHAMLLFNGGDSGVTDTGTPASDLASSFALSTNLFGKNQVQIAGSVGQTAALTPAVRGIAAIYRRDSSNWFAPSPEVTLTFSQFNRFGAPLNGMGQMSALRAMSLSVYQTFDPIDALHLEYGLSGESVDYLQHTARLSPFARVTLALDPQSEIIAAFSDGGRPDELTSHSVRQNGEAAPSANGELANAVNALSRLPQMSSRNGQLVLQRTQNYELGYGRRSGGRAFALSGFYERVSNGRLNVSGALSSLDSGNLLFDGMSKTSTLNVGSYVRSGYAGSVTQRIGANIDFGLSYGRLGGFSNVRSGSSLRVGGLHDVAGASLRASLPSTGTHFNAGYGWVQTGSVIPVHVFTTQANVASPGLNFALRQPIPSLFGLPGRLEVTADLRNLLAQGYIPIGSSGNGQLLVVQSPRAIRGGLNLTF